MCHFNYFVLYIYIYELYIYEYIYTHIVKLPYELRSREMCYPKIKLSPRVLGFCYILCCARYDASFLDYVYIYIYIYIYS